MGQLLFDSLPIDANASCCVNYSQFLARAEEGEEGMFEEAIRHLKIRHMQTGEYEAKEGLPCEEAQNRKIAKGCI